YRQNKHHRLARLSASRALPNARGGTFQPADSNWIAIGQQIRHELGEAISFGCFPLLLNKLHPRGPMSLKAMRRKHLIWYLAFGLALPWITFLAGCIWYGRLADLLKLPERLFGAGYNYFAI